MNNTDINLNNDELTGGFMNNDFNQKRKSREEFETKIKQLFDFDDTAFFRNENMDYIAPEMQDYWRVWRASRAEMEKEQLEYVLFPKVPTSEILSFIAKRGSGIEWGDPGHPNVIGKFLQRRENWGLNIVPPVYEYEEAAGVYKMLLDYIECK